MIGQSFYKSLNATYNPNSIPELEELLSCKLNPKSKEKSYPYGYRMATLGQPYKYYSPTGLLTGLFLRKSMEPISYRVMRIYNKLNYFRNRILFHLKKFKRSG